MYLISYMAAHVNLTFFFSYTFGCCEDQTASTEKSLPQRYKENELCWFYLLNSVNVKWLSFFFPISFREMLRLLQRTNGPHMCVWKWQLQGLVQSPRSLQWHAGNHFPNSLFPKIKYKGLELVRQVPQLLLVSLAKQHIDSTLTSPQDAFIKIVRNEGVKSLWSGLPPTLWVWSLPCLFYSPVALHPAFAPLRVSYWANVVGPTVV